MTTDSAAQTTVNLRIRGRVQGVGFRYSLCALAEQLDLRGWVRNRRDGSVEALAIGGAKAIAALTEWAHRGPPGARVDAVDVRPATAEESAQVGAGFAQLATL